jgi:N6-adenosine-specific RNA methylase IME4
VTAQSDAFLDAPSGRSKRYVTGIADPPWLERGGGQVKRGADRHYPLMATQDICALPVRQLFEANAHLYLWVTNNFLPDGLEVMAAWGVRYGTMVTWGKVRDGVIQVGLGQYFRGATEHILFGVRGSLPYRTRADGKRAQGRTLVLEARGEHSVKPDVFHQTAELVSPGPYVELFARRQRPGWDTWGNEVESTVEMPTSTPSPVFPLGAP